MSNPDDVRDRVRTAMAERGLSQKDAAAQVGAMSPATLNQWLKGVYVGDNAAVEGKLLRWLDAVAARRALVSATLDAPGFQRTETAERVWALLAQAQHGPDITVFAGAPGIGKTMTAEAYRAASPNVWLVTLDPELRSPHALLTEMCEAMGLPGKDPNGKRRAIGERVAGTGGLLVVDEGQHAGRPALDMLRSLHDRYAIGVCLLGNYGLYAGTSAASSRDGFAQFFSRVGARGRSQGSTKRDVDVMLDAWGFEDLHVRTFLHQIAGKAWALRGLRKTLGVAKAMAEGRGETLALPHMRAAWVQLNHFED